MGSRRANQPRSYHENTRGIVRVQRRFDDGMRMEPDTSGLDVGPNTDNPSAVQWLNNCRGYKNHIEGDAGTVRFTGANAAITITDNTETISVAIASGELFDANGQEEIEGGWIFEVLGTGDFTGDDLATAKGDAVRPHDHFQYVDDDEVEYLGNSRIPALEGFGDTTATEITATKAGTTITRSAGPQFSANVVGCFFVWNDGLRDPITEYVDEDNVLVANSETSKTGSMCKIEPDVYAAKQHETSLTLVLQAGEKLYMASSVPPTGWTEIVGCSSVPLFPSMSKLKDDRGDMILQNASGFFRIKLGAEPWFYKLNEQIPIELFGETYDANDRYQYRYFFTCSLIIGTDVLFKNRLSDDVLFDHESASNHMVVDEARDYCKVSSGDPISASNPTTFGLMQIPDTKCAYSHYSIYRTLSVADVDVARGNNENVPVWVTEVPVARGLILDVTAGG